MPLPKPNDGESKLDFINRCMSDDKMNEEYPDKEQRFAVCNQQTQKQETYNDYPQAATKNAKTALKWAEENGWGSCGTAVGKERANQLANREPISRDTIARMAAFERHRQNSKRPLGEGCGRLMWLAWGGDEGIEWASRKLKEIDNKKWYDSVQSFINKLFK